MFVWEPFPSFSLVKTNYNDSNCSYINSQEVVEKTCNYTGETCCEEVREIYNLTLNKCQDKIIYNCTLLNPDDEIIMFVIVSIFLCCICICIVYIFWFLQKKEREKKKNIYQPI